MLTMTTKMYIFLYTSSFTVIRPCFSCELLFITRIVLQSSVDKMGLTTLLQIYSTLGRHYAMNKLFHMKTLECCYNPAFIDHLLTEN